MGYSWGGFESLITFPPLDKRIYKDKIPGNLIRIYCGLDFVKFKYWLVNGGTITLNAWGIIISLIIQVGFNPKAADASLWPLVTDKI